VQSPKQSIGNQLNSLQSSGFSILKSTVPCADFALLRLASHCKCVGEAPQTFEKVFPALISVDLYSCFQR